MRWSLVVLALAWTCGPVWAGAKIPLHPRKVQIAAAPTTELLQLSLEPQHLSMVEGEQKPVTITLYQPLEAIGSALNVRVTWPNPRRTLPVLGTLQFEELIAEVTNVASATYDYAGVTETVQSNPATTSVTVPGYEENIPLPPLGGDWSFVVSEVEPGENVRAVLVLEAQ